MEDTTRRRGTLSWKPIPQLHHFRCQRSDHIYQHKIITDFEGVPNLTGTYRIESTAMGDGTSTGIEAYVTAKNKYGDYGDILGQVLTSQEEIMPGTWVELSVRYGLGLDPFDPRGNILAGTAYLREMHDRFGSAGFLAAYHAGPWRYEQHLVTGKPLPSETTAYVAGVRPLLVSEQGEHAAVDGRRAFPWREAPLFVERAGAP